MNLFPGSLDYFAAFLGGVLVSFTPCVYPLIPVTIGYIGINSAGSRLKGLVLSLVYVTGIAATYSFLGLFAAFSGTIFGAFVTHPFIYITAGAIIIFFSLTLIDLVPLPLRNIIRLPVFKKRGYFSVFILGATSGFLISPCLTPVLGSILAYLAVKRNLLYGAGLLFSFAYGMGAALVLLGIFSGLLVNFTKSGKWMLSIKRIYAMILFLSGAYFVFMGLRRM